MAAKQNDVAKVSRILLANPSDADFENPNFVSLLICMYNHFYFILRKFSVQDIIDENRPKKSMYCAECYQRVKRRKRELLFDQVYGEKKTFLSHACLCQSVFICFFLLS